MPVLIVIHSHCHSLQILWALGIPQCIVHSLYGSVSWGPEDDSVRVETSSPAVTLYVLYLVLLCLTDIFYPLYSINTSGWKTSDLSTLLWFGSCNYCFLACFLCSKNGEHSSSRHSSCCFNLYRAGISLAEVFIFSLIFSQALFMSLLSFKFSKATNLFVISIWYCFLTFNSRNLLRLSLSTSHFCVACLLICLLFMVLVW